MSDHGRGPEVDNIYGDRHRPNGRSAVLILAYGFYAVCAVLSFFFVWKWVSEAKSQELEDMPDR